MSRSLTSRRDFLKLLGLSSASLALNNFAYCTESVRERSNVLFIAIDDLNDWVGCLGGHPDVITPNLDRLARRGVLFTNAHCAAPLCNPSRAAIMTGIRPSTSGVYSNRQPLRKSEVLKEAVTLPQYFMENGYRTLGSGKIYHGSVPDPQFWHDYWPSKTKIRPTDPLPEKRPLNGIPDTRHFDWGPLDVAEEKMGDSRVADWVVGQLGRKQNEPFFLACGFFRPHLPWYVPRKYFDLYPLASVSLPEFREDDLEDVPEAGRRIALMSGDHAQVTKYNQWRRAVQGYLASISFVDHCVGRVIDALDKSAYRGNTIIVLWSDHGWHLGEKLHWRKFALWEEATHNVLTITVPGLTRPEAVCNAPVNLIDIYPTLIDLCGLEMRNELEGVSLLPLLENPEAEWDRPSLTTYGRNNHSLRSERWRYIRYYDGTEELYDHRSDEQEWFNLADDPRYAQVKENLSCWLPETNVVESPADRPGVITITERIKRFRN